MRASAVGKDIVSRVAQGKGRLGRMEHPFAGWRVDRAADPRSHLPALCGGERQTQASPDEKNVASGYLADCRGPGRWARFWMGARVEREGNGEEDGCLPEPRTFWSNCSRDLRISLT
jgi:hypothetical protein